MSKVIRLFTVASLWELAAALASSFTGAWFWDIHTSIGAIVFYYVILFLMMMGVFLSGPWLGRVMNSQQMILWGMALYIVYLLLLLMLGSGSRQVYMLLGVLNGLSSGLYWLALYVATSFWVAQGAADWYNGWIGVIENGFAIVAPPIAGWTIAAFRQTRGYQVIFVLAIVLLVFAILVVRGGKPPDMVPEETEIAPADRILWSRMLFSVATLGLRDGVLFVVPGLYLFVATGNPVLLGFYFTAQGSVETLAFYGVTRLSAAMRSAGLWWASIAVSLAGGLALAFLPLVPGVFAFGICMSLVYPIYKTAIESQALTVIQAFGHSLQERTSLTSNKEGWLNGGRMASLGLLLGFIEWFPAHRLAVMHMLLSVWPLTIVLIYVAYRRAEAVNTPSSE